MSWLLLALVMFAVSLAVLGSVFAAAESDRRWRAAGTLLAIGAILVALWLVGQMAERAGS